MIVHNGILLRSGLNLACPNLLSAEIFVVWNWNLLRTFWGFFWECFWFFFEIFRRKIEKKLQKHSKKNLKRFETISFLDDQKIESWEQLASVIRPLCNRMLCCIIGLFLEKICCNHGHFFEKFR